MTDASTRWLTLLLLSIGLAGCFAGSAGHAPVAGVSISSFAPSTPAVHVLTQEPAVVELHLSLRSTGTAREAAVRLTASPAEGCSGSWIPWRGDVLAEAGVLEARVGLPARGRAQMTRRLAFDCGRPGEFRFDLAAEVVAPPRRRAAATVTVKAAPHYVADELLAVFRSGLSGEQVASKAAALGTEVLEVVPGPEVVATLPGVRPIHWLRIVSGRSVPETIDLFLADPDVDVAEPNYVGGIDDHQELPGDLDARQWRSTATTRRGRAPA